jgi:hypothetical protein
LPSFEAELAQTKQTFTPWFRLIYQNDYLRQLYHRVVVKNEALPDSIIDFR